MSTSSSRQWLAEGAVILVSILLAFAVDAAWDRHVERKAEEVIRESLIADFEVVRDLLPVHHREHARTVAAVSHFIDLVEDARVGSVVPVPDSAIVMAIRNPSFDAPTGALDALLSSGDLRLISDPEPRRMLAAWPFRLQDATEDDRLLREFFGPELRRIMSEDVNLLVPLGRFRPGGTARVSTSTPIPVTDPLRGVLPAVRGSSGLAEAEERNLMLFVDSLLVRLRGEG